jgi:hypothetical protein
MTDDEASPPMYGLLMSDREELPVSSVRSLSRRRPLADVDHVDRDRSLLTVPLQL